MGERIQRWDSSSLEKLVGRILYFENPDGSFTAVIRTPDRFYFLPAEVGEAFVAGRPVEGSEVEIEKTITGYQLRLPQKTGSSGHHKPAKKT
jgi:hypothetical protein